MTSSYKWDLNRTVVFTHFKSSAGWETRRMIWFSHKTGKAQGISTSSTGGHAESAWDQHEGRPVQRFETYGASGPEGKAAVLYRKINEKTMKAWLYQGPRSWELTGEPVRKVTYKKRA